MGLYESRSGTETRRAWEANVDSPDDAADVIQFDQQAAITTTVPLPPVYPSLGTVNRKYPWSARCSHHLVASGHSIQCHMGYMPSRRGRDLWGL
jgi:hypothetical protein